MLYQEKRFNRLLRGLKDKNEQSQKNAMINLVKMGKHAVWPLIKVLKGNNTEIRELVVITLGKIGDPNAVPPLIYALNDRNVRVREQSIIALGIIGDLNAVEPLISRLND